MLCCIELGNEFHKHLPSDSANKSTQGNNNNNNNNNNDNNNYFI